jgi:hypothetical protein
MGDPLTQRLALADESIELIDEVDGQQVSFDSDSSDRSVPFEQRSRLGDNDFFADPFRHELGDQGVQPACRLVVGPGELRMTP